MKQSFLILKLEGPMQAWGGHTYEDYRPSHEFPTRSGLVGLLAACLGIEREDKDQLLQLSESIAYAVRVDQPVDKKTPVKLQDFHTVEDTLKVGSKVNENQVVSKREYWHDASFTVALWTLNENRFNLNLIEAAVHKPCYTPVLGRRSCPIARPLFEMFVEADNPLSALKAVSPKKGIVYSEAYSFETVIQSKGIPLKIRDVPSKLKGRQFLTRTVYIHNQKEDSENVPQ